MNIKYTTQIDKIICDHENDLFKTYLGIVNSYAECYSKYNCILKIQCAWINSLKNVISSERLPFQNGYMCYILCEVQRDGEIVHYDADDGESDYYELVSCWNISSISRSWSKLNVILCNDFSDIKQDLDEYISILEQLS